MQDIVFYAAVNETQGIVRDSANARNQSAPVLVLGVSACLKMRLFAACNVATPYPAASLSDISSWNWRMDSDFERNTPSKLVADANDIFVHTVTDSVDGETVTFTEFVIPISDMNTQELATWLGNEKKRSGLVGELVGYDVHENAVFVLQIEDFTIRNRIAGLGDPTAIEQEVATRSQTAQMIQAAVSSSAATKQDKLTSANAGTNISIDENGVISNTYSLPSATTGSKGGVMLATTAETISGSNATKAITPAAFLSALSGDNPIIAKSAIQAFQSINELGSASTSSLKSGGAYRLSAVSGNHYLTVPDVPADKVGTDAYLELFVGDTSLIHMSDPLILMDVLIPNAVNDCVIKFRDGTARMFVEDHAYGYVVTVTGGTEGTQLDGSLHYGLSGSTAGYVTFTNAMNGSACDLGGATTNGEKHVVGNGYTQTVISGGVSCTSKTTFSNLGMNDVSVLGGTMTLGDVYIPSGATVSVNGGWLAIERVLGDGGVIDLGGKNATLPPGGTAYVSGCVVSGGSGNLGGGFYSSRTDAGFVSCTITGNTATLGGGGIFYFNPLNLVDTVCSGNTGQYGADLYLAGNTTSIEGSTVGSIMLDGGATVVVRGENKLGVINRRGSSTNSVTVSSGASISLTSGMIPGGEITLYGGHYEDPTTIIGSGGISRTFEDLEIKGSTINSAGLIYGATVYSNEGDDHEVRYTEDGGATSSSVIVAGQTVFAIPGGLMQVLNT